MARFSRPELVKKLTAIWATYYKRSPYLHQVKIGGDVPLRGIIDSTLQFEFPVTVICGPNGTGKTTFLSLSVLAFHDENALTLSNIRSYYDFSYFFGFSGKEKHEKGISIEWCYTNGHTEKVLKGSQRWMRYIKNDGTPRRPERGTEFVGLSRILPSFEKKGYQRLFSNIKRCKEITYNEKISSYLAEIMSRPYESLISYEAKSTLGSFRMNDYNTHSSFNAGAGEECLTYILATLLSSKEGSIVALEEIEIGLHPATMEKLVDVILTIALERKLQLIITTHSPDFLRACPKESLVLAERDKNKQVRFTRMPHIETAIYRLSGKASVHAYIVCEDEWASGLITSCLTKRQKEYVKVFAYGGQDELIKKAQLIQKASDKNVLIIWDGDARASLMSDEELVSDEKLFACKLPGNVCPEKYVIEKIMSETVKDSLMSEFNLEESDWINLKDSVSVITDPHDLKYICARCLGISMSDLIQPVCRQVVSACLNEFEEVKLKILEASS